VSARSKGDAAGKPRYLPELLDGLRFVRTNTLVLSMVLVAAVTNFLDVPLMTVVLPVYARGYYGSAESLGVMVGSLAAGAFVGTLLFGAVGRRLPRRLTFISSFVLAPLLFYAALVATPLAVVVAAGALGGLISGPINPLYETVIQEQTPPQMLGRVFGALQALSMAGIPFGTALAGLTVQGLGVIPTVVGMGVVYVAVTLSMFVRPALRQMDVPAAR
jgi:MFS family permease